MTVKKVNPYWHDKDYKPPLKPKKRPSGKRQKPLTKEQKANLKRGYFPWEQ